jgi:hypothetical protein
MLPKAGLTPARPAAAHVQAAVGRTAQARLAPPPVRPVAPGPAPHVQAQVRSHIQARIQPNAAAVQARTVPLPRPAAAHVQAALGRQVQAAAAPRMAPARVPALAPPPVRPVPRPMVQALPPRPVTSQPAAPAVQARPAPFRPSPAVIQPATAVSYFTSQYSQFARRMRRTQNVGGRNLATACYQIQQLDGSWGARRVRTMPSEGFHSEKRLYDSLEGLGQTYRVLWVYTELAPCGDDNHNCAQRLEDWWPDAEVYYSVDYPNHDEVSTDDSSDSEDTKERRKREKAKRRRKRGPGTLKRCSTYLRKNDSDSDDGPDEDSFKPKLQRIHSPLHYANDPGWNL